MALGGFLKATSLVALIGWTGAPVDGSTVAQDRTVRQDNGERTISFSVPLVSSTSAYGDVLIEASLDGRYRADRQSLRRELVPLLNEDGLVALDRAMAEGSFVTQEALAAEGFLIRFDSGQIQLVIESLPANFRQTRALGRGAGATEGIDLTAIEPAGFSSYVNVTSNLDYDSEFGRDDPDLFFDGATRIANVVLEYEAAYSRQFSDDYRLLRRRTRAVYDDPARFRRYSAGDVRPLSMSIMRAPDLGGIAIERSRQIYDPFVAATRLSGRQILINNRSTVDIMVGGVLYETLQLEAGTYDLSQLPVQQGANDIQLVVRDSFGRREVINFDFFAETLELPAGEVEYGAAVGFVSDVLAFEPDYSDDIAVTAYYRKAFSSDLVAGASLQATQDIQLVGATLSSVPQFIPGLFDFEVAGSQSDSGTGIALRSAYRLLLGGSSDNASQLVFNLDYENAAYTTLSDPLSGNFSLFAASASYSRALGSKAFGVVGANYLSAGSGSDTYNVFADYNRRVSSNLRLRVGGEYGRLDGNANFGVRAGLSFDFGNRMRASADYRSRIDSFRANLSKSARDGVGGMGYEIALSRIDGDPRGDFIVDYAANRFDARASVSTGGAGGFGSFFNRQNARLQLRTSLAYADGMFGIGRPIYDSFLLARPHPATKGSDVITGRSLSGPRYDARSGLLGAAVQRDLSAFNQQSLQYDFADPEMGYDAGDGTVHVDPPYRGGYKLVVGDDHFVSALGILADENGPIALATGRLVALDENEDFEPLPLFTNSAGRFALSGLAPGKDYEIHLYKDDRRVRISIPDDSEALVRMGTLVVPSAE